MSIDFEDEYPVKLERSLLEKLSSNIVGEIIYDEKDKKHSPLSLYLKDIGGGFDDD